MTGSPGESQQEGQEDQGEVKEPGGTPSLAVLRSPGPPGLSSGSSLGSPELPPARYFQGPEGNANAAKRNTTHKISEELPVVGIDTGNVAMKEKATA